jgi:tetraacyldisaccharide 4'-kinase
MADKSHSAWREFTEETEQYAIEVILGRRSGLGASLLRGFLWCFSLIFRQGVRARYLLHKARLVHRRRLGCLVISVGNITVGGTGKTPVVEYLSRCLRDSGRRVAILSRGYRSKAPPKIKHSLLAKMKALAQGKRLRSAPAPRIVSDGRAVLLDSHSAGDEPYMLARNLKGVSVVVDKDRVTSGQLAIDRLEADTLVLDDGLQYLKLHHHLDIVLVDSTAPFGNQHLLPRGTLREPRQHLSRASYIILTKCDGSDQGPLRQQIRKFNPAAEIIESRHRAVHVENALTGIKRPLSMLKGKWVGAFCAIAVPQSFEKSLEDLGATVRWRKSYADHHRFSDEEIYSFIAECKKRDLDYIITTEKDFVRFPRLPYSDVPIYFLRVEIEILKGQEIWDAMIQRICARRELPLWVQDERPMLTPELSGSA